MLKLMLRPDNDSANGTASRTRRMAIAKEKMLYIRLSPKKKPVSPILFEECFPF